MIVKISLSIKILESKIITVIRRIRMGKYIHLILTSMITYVLTVELEDIASVKRG